MAEVTVEQLLNTWHALQAEQAIVNKIECDPDTMVSIQKLAYPPSHLPAVGGHLLGVPILPVFCLAPGVMIYGD